MTHITAKLNLAKMALMPQTMAVAMNAALDATFFYYRHKCRLDVQFDSHEQQVVLQVGPIGALYAPIELAATVDMPVIRHPDGQHCTILTEGNMRMTARYRAGLSRTGVTLADSGSWVVLPLSNNDPGFGWVWVPSVLEPDFALPRPSAVFTALNSTPAAHQAMSVDPGHFGRARALGPR